MSQNPNYNPYGQNPPDPNATPGTSYGSPPPPPGQSQGPASGYGSYNPYTPNPPTPGPAVNPNYNPYDPYAPTVAGPAANADFNPYAPPLPPPPPPTQPRPRGVSGKVILLVVLALVLIAGGIAFGLVSYNTTQTNNANATATAQTNGTQTAQAHLTTTAIASATAYAIQHTYPFSSNLKLDDSLTDNSKGFQWQENNYCKFSGSAYHVLDPETNTYNPCAAINTNFSDFTFEVEMSISKGDGGGLIFRGNSDKSQYYRIAIFTDGSYAIYVYVDTTSTNARTLKSGSIGQTLNATNTIGVVARGQTITLYVNQQEITSVTDSTYTHGQIGFAAVNQTTSADVVFTNAKVWELAPGS